MYNIYRNIRKSLAHQNVALGPELASDAFLSKINISGYITMDGARKCVFRGDASMFVIIAAVGSKYTDKGPEFTKLLKIIPTGVSEINIYSDSDLSTHVLKVATGYREANPDKLLNMYHHKIFVYDLLTHVSSIPHEICSAEFAKEFELRIHAPISRLSKISSTDPAAIWIGARPGMLIRIRRPSETAGEAIVYRYCKLHGAL
jgi:DNA-directed RNA polymerase subunit H